MTVGCDCWSIEHTVHAFMFIHLRSPDCIVIFVRTTAVGCIFWVHHTYSHITFTRLHHPFFVRAMQ